MMQFESQLSHLCVIVFSCFVLLVSGATLPDNEVEALKEIANTLGKKDWNFSVDPCSGDSGWEERPPPPPPTGPKNTVSCNCSYANNTVCHVVSIVLNSQSLPGILPPELVKLPYLQQIDLTRNYLNGSIPKEWGSLPLINISLAGNLILGPIPLEFTNITSLRNLILGYNNLYGALPPELGNMVNLERIYLSSNDFSGPLPETLANLTKLKYFRISDNSFTGKIPNFIQYWTKLEKLSIQGSGLQGPIPSVISSLTNLHDMRISDLSGSTDAPFPPLYNMKIIKTL